MAARREQDSVRRTRQVTAVTATVLTVAALVAVAPPPAWAGRIYAKKRTMLQQVQGGEVTPLALNDAGAQKLRVTSTGAEVLAILFNADCRVDSASNTDSALLLSVTVDGAAVGPAGRVLCRSGVDDSISGGSARASYNAVATVGAGTHTVRVVADFGCCMSTSYASIEDLSLIVITGDP